MVADIETQEPDGDGVAADAEVRGWSRYLHVIVAIVAVIVDQLSKVWAVTTLDDEVIELALGIQLRLVRNPGFAFSQGRSLGPVIAVVAAIVVVVLWRMGINLKSATARVALGLVLGGAAGNLIDRVFRAGNGFLGGEVVDFIDFGWWPVFNIADACIVVGAILLALIAIRQPSP